MDTNASNAKIGNAGICLLRFVSFWCGVPVPYVIRTGCRNTGLWKNRLGVWAGSSGVVAVALLAMAAEIGSGKTLHDVLWASQQGRRSEFWESDNGVHPMQMRSEWSDVWGFQWGNVLKFCYWKPVGGRTLLAFGKTFPLACSSQWKDLKKP